MRKRCVLTLLAILAAAADAQWLNFPLRGRPVPGKPNLSAPASLVGGKPNVSSVWMHEIPTVAEVKRLFGDVPDDVSSECARNGNRYWHKYGFNI